MNPDDALQRDQRRVDELIQALESLDDARGRELAGELLQIVLRLHAGGLARLMEIVQGAGAPGRAIVESMLLDARINALLLLHGLHPHDLEARVHEALERLRAPLGARGLRLDVAAVDEPVVRLRLAGGGARSSGVRIDELRQEVEQAVYAAAPEVASVEIEGLHDAGADVREVAFVPVATLRRQAVR